ncbi:MAG: M56 family metallopeptidase [Planctomycetaceae bacterium]|nr:M56 family metallopeptidase [Planctomycetaceae bacterium]
MSNQDLWNALAQGLLGFTISVLLVFIIEKMPLRLTANHRSWLWRAVYIKTLFWMIFPTSFIGSLETRWIPRVPIVPSAWAPSNWFASANGLPKGEQVSNDFTVSKSTQIASDQSTDASSKTTDSPSDASFKKPSVPGLESSSEISLEPSSRSFSIQPWHAIVLWSLGATCMASVILYRSWKTIRILRRSTHRAPSHLMALSEQIAKSLGIRQIPQIQLSSEASVPMLVYSGAMRLVLPSYFESRFGVDGCRMGIAHELAHYKRSDLWWNLLPTFVSIVLFFWPPAWLAARRYYLAMELACDELAIRAAKLEHTAYAGLLVRLLEDQARHTMPSPALSMARSGGFRTLSERIRFLKFDLFGSRYRRAISTLMTMATLGLIVMPWGFSSPRSLYAQSIDDFTPVKIDLDTIDHPREIPVVDSQGKPVKEFYYLPANRDVSYNFDDLVNYPINGEITSDDRKPLAIVRSESGTIQLPLPQNCDCVEIWNEQGVASLPLSQIRTLESIRLQPWASLQIRPARDTKIQPAKDLFISRDPIAASSGHYRVTLLDDQTLEIPRCFPGEWLLQIQNRTGDIDRHFKIRPGENKMVDLEVRAIRGRFVLEDESKKEASDDLSKTTAYIQYEDIRYIERIPIQPDGSFEFQNVPYGKHKLKAFKTVTTDREIDWSAELFFDCDVHENDEVLDLGLIPFKKPIKTELPQSDLENPSIAPGGQTIDRISAKGFDRRFHQLFDASGKEMIVGAPIEKDNGFGGGSEGAQGAIDDKNSKVYLIGRRDGKPKTLYVYSIKGELIRELELLKERGRRGDLVDPFWRIAVNKDNGNLWLLSVNYLGKSKIQILDNDLDAISRFPSDVFNMSYSEADKAMWTVSPTAIAKCNPDLYLVDRDCQKVVCTDLGSKSLLYSVAVQEDIIWLKGRFYNSSLTKESNEPRAVVVLGFDMQLNYLPDKKLAVEDFPKPRDSSRVGVFPR